MSLTLTIKFDRGARPPSKEASKIYLGNLIQAIYDEIKIKCELDGYTGIKIEPKYLNPVMVYLINNGIHAKGVV